MVSIVWYIPPTSLLAYHSSNRTFTLRGPAFATPSAGPAGLGLFNMGSFGRHCLETFQAPGYRGQLE